MPSGGGKQTTTEHKEIRLPPWVEQASFENYERAKDVANRPYEANPYDTVAGFNKDFWLARDKVRELDDYDSYYGTAEKALQGLLKYNPADISMRSVTAPTMKDVNIQQYMDPFIGQVEANAVRNMTNQGQIDQRRLAADATKSGGLGGSRQGIQQALQGAKTVQAIGDTSAKLRSDAFNQATSLAQQDLARQYQAAVQTGNWQQAAEIQSRQDDLQAHGQTIAASKQMTDTATAGRQSKMDQMAARLSFGQMMQEQAQRVRDKAASRWQKARDYPLEQLNILLASLGMSPYGHTEDSTSTTTGGGGGGGFGQALGTGLGILKMFAGLAGASDRDLKTNIELIDDSGPLPIYAYDYKADVRAAKKAKRPMPMKRVGPMAQDLEKIAPGMVKRVGRRRVIDLTALEA